jgi:hypothetical protein
LSILARGRPRERADDVTDDQYDAAVVRLTRISPAAAAGTLDRAYAVAAQSGDGELAAALEAIIDFQPDLRDAFAIVERLRAFLKRAKADVPTRDDGLIKALEVAYVTEIEDVVHPYVPGVDDDRIAGSLRW